MEIRRGKRNLMPFTFVCMSLTNKVAFEMKRVILQYLKRMIRLCEEHKVKLNLISSIEVGNVDESENKRLFAKVEEGLKKRRGTI